VRSELSIEIAAAPRRVFELARDIAKWPEMLPHYRKVTIQSRRAGRTTATMAAVRPLLRLRSVGVPVWWRTEQWADESDPADLQVLFNHTGGATRGMAVVWHIRPSGRGARVVIEHDFERRLPLLGSAIFPRIVDRFFVRPIATRTLARFKALAESGSA
jgi:ribosome-associated toxin RatA of RatAB toxin-antitoxin module